MFSLVRYFSHKISTWETTIYVKQSFFFSSDALHQSHEQYSHSTSRHHADSRSFKQHHVQFKFNLRHDLLVLISKLNLSHADQKENQLLDWALHRRESLLCHACNCIHYRNSTSHIHDWFMFQSFTEVSCWKHTQRCLRWTSNVNLCISRVSRDSCDRVRYQTCLFASLSKYEVDHSDSFQSFQCLELAVRCRCVVCRLWFQHDHCIWIDHRAVTLCHFCVWICLFSQRQSLQLNEKIRDLKNILQIILMSLHDWELWSRSQYTLSKKEEKVLIK